MFPWAIWMWENDLLRAIAGLDLQTRGRLVQAGKDISNLPASERDYGIVFQSYALFPNLTIEKNIAFGLENTGRTKNEIEQRVAELLQLIGLPDQGPKYPAQLSKWSTATDRFGKSNSFWPRSVVT